MMLIMEEVFEGAYFRLQTVFVSDWAESVLVSW